MNCKGMEEMLLSIGSAAEAVGRLAAATRTTTTAIFSHHPLSLHGRCASILYRSSMLCLIKLSKYSRVDTACLDVAF